MRGAVRCGTLGSKEAISVIQRPWVALLGLAALLAGCGGIPATTSAPHATSPPHHAHTVKRPTVGRSPTHSTGLVLDGFRAVGEPWPPGALAWMQRATRPLPPIPGMMGATPVTWTWTPETMKVFDIGGGRPVYMWTVRLSATPAVPLSAIAVWTTVQGRAMMDLLNSDVQSRCDAFAAQIGLPFQPPNGPGANAIVALVVQAGGYQMNAVVDAANEPTPLLTWSNGSPVNPTPLSGYVQELNWVLGIANH